MKFCRKTGILFIILASAAMLLSACNKPDMTSEDAQKYVEVYFEASLKGNAQEYAKITGESGEEVEKQYEDRIQDLAMQMGGIAGTEADFPDKVTEASQKMLASAKYEVGEGKKGDDGNYTVEVKAYPSDILTVFLNKIVPSAGGSIGDAIVQTMDEAVQEQSFGEAVSYQVGVAKVSKDSYTVEGNDVNEVIAGLFAEAAPLVQASGKVFDDPYLNWKKAEWEAASDGEKTLCCVAIVQYLMGETDEEMPPIDPEDLYVQKSIQQIIDGINLTFSTSTEISIGDFADIMKDRGF